MKQVNFKGLALLEFPDDWDDQKIQSYLRDNEAEADRYVTDQLKRKAVAETDFEEQVAFEQGKQGFFETLGSRVGAAAEGATRGVASVPKMAGRAAELAPPAPAANVTGGFTRPVVTPELQAKFDQTAADRAGETPQQRLERTEANPAVRWGQGLIDDVGEVVPALPGDRNSFLTQVAQGVGTSIGGVATGLALGPAGAMAAMWSAEADDAYEEELARQREAGETPNPDKAFLKAAGYGTIASAVEAGLGVGYLARNLQKAFGGTPKEALKKGLESGVMPKFIAGVGKASAAGYTEEATQRLAQDLIVHGKPNWEAIHQEGLVGAFTQGLLDVPASATEAFQRGPTAAPLADTADILPGSTEVVDQMDEIISPPPALTAEELTDDAAALPQMKPGEATPGGTPIPETPAALSEQIRLTADPESSKAATLITPGEAAPDDLPDGLMQVKTKHGMVIFNPDKIGPDEIAEAASGDVFDGTVLGMAGDGKTPVQGRHVVTTSTPAADNVVTEVVPDNPANPAEPDPAAVEAAANAQAAAVPGGTTEVKPAIEVAKERKASVDEEIEADVEEAWKTIQEDDKASVSHLQRKLKWGYQRAVKAISELEKRGRIGPANGATPRTINRTSETPQPAAPAETQQAGVVAPATGGVVAPPGSISNEDTSSEDVDAKWVNHTIERSKRSNPSLPDAFWNGPFRAVLEKAAKVIPAKLKEMNIQTSERGFGISTDTVETAAIKSLADLYQVMSDQMREKGVSQTDFFNVEYVGDGVIRLTANDPKLDEVFSGFSNRIAERPSLDLNAKQLQSDFSIVHLFDTLVALHGVEFGSNEQPEKKPEGGEKNEGRKEEGRKEEGLLNQPEDQTPGGKPPASTSPDDAAKAKAKADLDAALSDLADLFGTKLNIVPEQRQKVFPVLVRVMDAAFRMGYYKFKEAAKFVLQTLRGRGAANIADALTISDLQGAYIAMSSGVEGADDSVTVVSVKTKEEIDSTQPAKLSKSELTKQVLETWKSKRQFTTPEIDKAIKDSDLTDKEVDEAIEVAIVQAVRWTLSAFDGSRESAKQVFDTLVTMYGRQPNLSTRTAESKVNQAYSTPSPLAFVGQVLGQIMSGRRVVEPTVGNGMLVTAAKNAEIVANEIDPNRAEQFESTFGVKPTQMDAASPEYHAALVKKAPDRAAMNPPFGNRIEGEGTARFQIINSTVAKSETPSLDMAIMLNTFDALPADGKGFAIIGAKTGSGFASFGTEQNRKDAYRRPEFLDLFARFNVVGWYTIDGSLYRKQGAGWPVDIIIIDGKRPTPRESEGGFPRPWMTVPKVLKTWAEVGGLLDDNRSADQTPRGKPGDRTQAPMGEPEGQGGPRPVPPGTRPDAGTGNAPASPGGIGLRGGGTGGSRKPSGEQPAAPGRGEDSTAGTPDVVQQPGPAESQKSPRPVPPASESLTEGFTVPYPSVSKAGPTGLVTPKNIADDVRRALDELEQEVGMPVDDYVADRLKMTKEALFKGFSSAQIDSLALAIRNVERGSALINSDQTGVGKGRVVAGLIRYARINGLVPVFVTAKKDLYTDMAGRDLPAIGETEVVPAITDADTVYKDSAGNEVRVSKDSQSRRDEWEQAARSGDLPGGANAIFTTYYQLGSDVPQGFKEDAKAKARRKAKREPKTFGPIWRTLETIAPKAIFILDEAHESAGPDSDNNHRFSRVLPRAKGIYYSSATYAKRPDNLGLYGIGTLIKRVGMSQKAMIAMFRRGGLALQQAVTTMLAKSGEFIRRQQDWKGVEIRFERASNDAKREVAAADTYTRFLHALNRFSRLMASVAKDLQDEENQVLAEEERVNIESVNFGSRLYNLSSQYLFALRSKAIATKALSILKAGEKPFIAVTNTMEGPIEGLKSGGYPVSFTGLLLRELQNLLTVTIRSRNHEKPQKRTFRLDELPPQLVEEFQRIKREIEAADLSEMPISPIDYIIEQVRAAGFSIDEMTARTTTYTKDNETGKGASGNRKRRSNQAILEEYNNGGLDAVIGNQTAATGVSAHTDPRFKDQRVRHMIVGQAQPDINLFMQMLGRIMRYGQTKLPQYTVLQSSLAAEKRFMVLLRRKLASLNANTSADTESELTANEGFTDDIFNEVGDVVVANVLGADPVTQQFLGVSYTEGDEDNPGAFATRATGRFVLLPNAKAEELWTKIGRQYQDTIKMLDERGENPLKATVEDFRAKTKEVEKLVDGQHGKTPFDGPAMLETIEITAQTPPPTYDEVMAKANEAKRTVDKRVADWLSGWEEARENRLREMAEAGMTQVQIDAAVDRFTNTKRMVEDAAGLIGTAEYSEAGNVLYVITDIKLHGDDPADYSSSSRQMIVARTNQVRSYRTMGMFSYFSHPLRTRPQDPAEEWKATSEDTAVRKVITGNLIAGYSDVGGAGRVVVYTRDDGSLNTGLLLPVNWVSRGEAKARTPITSEDQFLQAFRNPAAKIVSDNVTIENGVISVPASGEGRRVWSSREFRTAVPRNQQRGGNITGPVADPAMIFDLLTNTLKRGVFSTPTERPKASTDRASTADSGLTREQGIAKVRMATTEAGVDADVVWDPEWTVPTKSGGTAKVQGTAETGTQPMRLNAAVLAGKTKAQIKAVIRHELIHPALATEWGIAQLSGWELTAEQVSELQEAGYLQEPGESDQDYQIRLKDEFVAREAESESSWWRSFVQRVKEALAKLGIRNLSNQEIARRIIRNIAERRAAGVQARAIDAEIERMSTDPGSPPRGPGSDVRPGRSGPVGGGRPPATDPERSLPVNEQGIPIQPGDRRRASRSEFGSPQYVLQKERERTLAAERFIDESASLKDALDRINSIEDTALRSVIAAEVAARAAEHMRLPGRAGVLDPIDAAKLVERATRELQGAKTDSAQAVQAQKQANRRLGPFKAVLSYLELVRTHQQRRLEQKFPKVVSDNIRSWLRVSARLAVEEVARQMKNPANVVTRKLREVAAEADIDWSDLFQSSWATQREAQFGLYRALRQHPDLAKLTADEVRELTNLFISAWSREHNLIFQREFRKKVPAPGVAENDMRRLIRSLPRLVRYLNLGLLDEPRFLNAIAPEYGMGAVDDAVVIRLSELAQEAQRTPEGVRRNKVYQRMVEEIWKTGGINAYDLARDFWFANVLSGVRTWIDVGVGSWISGLTMVGRAAADVTVRGHPRMAARMVSEFVLATGEAIANGIDIIKTGDTTRLPNASEQLWDVLSGRGGHNSLEAAKASSSGWKRAIGQMAYVRRIMVALDYVGSMGTRDALMAWVALSRDDQASLQAAMARFDRKARREALDQAEAEMPDAKRVDQRARAREIMEEQIDREVRDAATVLGQVAALNADPVGIGGILYGMIARVPWLLRAPAGLSFARAAINMAQNASDWMPLFGSVNWLRSKATDAAWFQNLPKPLQAFGLDVPPERRRLIAAAQIGGLVLTSALLGFAGDDDDQFEITGTWTGMAPAKRSQLMSQGERPLSIRIGNTWISYRNTPFAAAMAFVGNIRDRERFDRKRWDAEELSNRLASAWLMGALYIKDVSAMSQFAAVIGASAYSTTDELKSGAKWAADTIGNFGAGFIPGASALREIDTMTDPSVYRPNAGIEYWLRNVPFARRTIGDGPAVNVLGEEISAARTPWSRWISLEPDDEVWTALSAHAAKGVFIPGVSKTTSIVGRTGERRTMNDEEFYAYSKAAGAEWRKALERELRFIKSAPPEAVQGWIKRKVDDVHASARRRVSPTE